jgi:uncharacterized protein (DUF2252 family)
MAAVRINPDSLFTYIEAWIRELQSKRTQTLDAPSWLWSSVVQLVGSHEQGYLTHCRRYALQN